MSLNDWLPTTRTDDDSFNLGGIVELKASVPVVYTYVPPLFEGKVSGHLREDVLPFDTSRLRPEEQGDTEYWVNYMD